MATSKEYAAFILEQLPEGSRIRPMMGEYVVYFRDKVVGDICDGRFLVKPVPAAAALMPNAPRELPYEGAAKEMLLVQDVENREFLEQLMESMFPELPAPKSKRKRP